MLQKCFSHTGFQKFYDCENIELSCFTALENNFVSKIDGASQSMHETRGGFYDDEHKTCLVNNRISGALLEIN